MIKGKITYGSEEVAFYDSVDKIPTGAKNGRGEITQARLYLPREWIGKKVRVLKLEE